jgi:N6-adenosine-specific RNA methylase IME4
MPLDEIKTLRVRDCPKDAVLFLWVPGSLLNEGLQVVDAWGFEYKTCAVWDRVHAGQGPYFRMQHEILMFAKRGETPSPPEKKRAASIIRSPRGDHSAKPIAAYEMIEAMYPELAKLELFCRGQPRDGWAGWGNECTMSLRARAA